MPHGYSARFDLNAAPRWLRSWAAVPFIDRFAYPLLVKRGFAYLTAQPILVCTASADEMARGWKMEDPNCSIPEVTGRSPARTVVRARAVGTWVTAVTHRAVATTGK